MIRGMNVATMGTSVDDNECIYWQGWNEDFDTYRFCAAPSAEYCPARDLNIANDNTTHSIFGFMAILAVAVTEAVQVVGVLLIFALIVTPAAIAVRFTSRPTAAILTGVGLALVFTWLGLSIAYYSPHPVSFFITSLAFATYVAVRVAEPIRGRLQRRTAGGGAATLG